MAGELVRRGSDSSMSRTGGSGVAKKAAKHAMKAAAKHPAKRIPAKHAAKHTPAKHAAKHAGKHAEKHAAKRARTEGAARSRLPGGDAAVAALLEGAFHAMQRAGAVISLLDKETGGDLRDLLFQGVEIYRQASEARGAAAIKPARAAAGLLEAAEHLAMAGLYAAREKHLLSVPASASETTEGRIVEVSRQLGRLPPRPDKTAAHLVLIAAELVKQAEAADPDVHLAYELVMAAEGLVLAVENWPEA